MFEIPQKTSGIYNSREHAKLGSVSGFNVRKKMGESGHPCRNPLVCAKNMRPGARVPKFKLGVGCRDIMESTTGVGVPINFKKKSD